MHPLIQPIIHFQFQPRMLYSREWKSYHHRRSLYKYSFSLWWKWLERGSAKPQGSKNGSCLYKLCFRGKKSMFTVIEVYLITKFHCQAHDGEWGLCGVRIHWHLWDLDRLWVEIYNREIALHCKRCENGFHWQQNPVSRYKGIEYSHNNSFERWMGWSNQA